MINKEAESKPKTLHGWIMKAYIDGATSIVNLTLHDKKQLTPSEYADMIIKQIANIET
jgi:hypothetical protein